MRDWAGKNISSSETKDLSELVLRHVVPDRGADVHHHPSTKKSQIGLVN